MSSPGPTLRRFTLALIQLGHATSNKTVNLKHARAMILKAACAEAHTSRPDLIVLPECFNGPYGAVPNPHYAEVIGFAPGSKTFNPEKSDSPSVRMLSSVAKEISTWILGGSILEKDSDGKIYNTATVYSPAGELVAIHRKVHLYDVDIPGKIKYKESDIVTPGSSTNYFDTDFARVGLGICYDVRFPELAMINTRQGCHVLIYPGAFNTVTGPMHWELLLRSHAVDQQVYFAMCSPARDPSADYHVWGHSMIVDPLGSILVEAQEQEEIIYADIEPQVLSDTRAQIPVTSQRRFDVYPDISRGSATGKL